MDQFFLLKVSTSDADADKAAQVINERVHHDEDLGFDYEISSVDPLVTDTNEDGSPAFSFEPWSDGHAVGFRVTRHADGAVSYVYLNPSQDTWSDGALHPDAFVYTGPDGNPGGNDVPRHFYSIEFEGNA